MCGKKFCVSAVMAIALMSFSVESLAQEGITANVYPPYIDAGTTLVLTAAAGSGYQWALDGTPISGATNRQFILDPVLAVDEGTYTVSYNNGSEDMTDGIVITVASEGSVPVAGSLGLAAVVGACALGGTAALRRRD